MLLIDVTIAVSGDVTGRLLSRPDFAEEEDGEDGQIVWWGERVDRLAVRSVVLRLAPRRRGPWRWTSSRRPAQRLEGLYPRRDRAPHTLRPCSGRLRGTRPSPWVVQQARNLFMDLEVSAPTRARHPV